MSEWLKTIFWSLVLVSPSRVMAGSPHSELLHGCGGSSFAASSGSCAEATEDACGEPLFGSITPLTCSKATGDWWGARKDLAESGVTVDARLTQFYMGVVNGGIEKGGRYSKHGDYVMNIDGDRLPGIAWTLRQDAG